MMNKFSAVIFDLDGTLVDSIQDIADSMNRTLTHFGYKTYRYDEYKYFVGNGLMNLVAKCLPEDKRTESHIEEVLFVMMSKYRKNSVNKTVLYPGIPELLDHLSEKNYKMAVLSNKADVLTQDIAMQLLYKWNFEIILGASDFFPRKPNPQSALFIAEELHVQPENILYLGDTDTDMKTANAAGMYAVGVSWGFRERKELEENGAKLIIDKPEELIKALLFPIT